MGRINTEHFTVKELATIISKHGTGRQYACVQWEFLFSVENWDAHMLSAWKKNTLELVSLARACEGCIAEPGEVDLGRGTYALSLHGLWSGVAALSTILWQFKVHQAREVRGSRWSTPCVANCFAQFVPGVSIDPADMIQATLATILELQVIFIFRKSQYWNTILEILDVMWKSNFSALFNSLPMNNSQI
jgi:hypothetical protein